VSCPYVDPDEVDEELLDLISEPPGGHQYGRKRGLGGGWIPLNEDLAAAYEEDLTVESAPQAYHRPTKPEDTIVHGTLSAYTNDRCRCDVCRKAMRDWKRSRRGV
jgi:hypothetical protein